MGLFKVIQGSTGVAAALLASLLASAPAGQAAEAPITIAINQSPWFAGFQKLVTRYSEETGNPVALDVNPAAGLLEKERAALRAPESPFDIVALQNGTYVEMYDGGFLRPLTEIDPGFKLEAEILPFDDTMYWDPSTKQMNKNGQLLTVPINPNIPLLFYRKDLYEAAGLQAPETFAALKANAEKLNDQPAVYGIVQRGARGVFDVTYDFLPYLWGFGGDLFKDQKSGDYTVTIDSPESVAALQYYADLAKTVGHPQTAGQSQAQVVQNLLTGKAANAILVVAAWSQMDDPEKSAVVDQIAYAVPPHAEGHPSAPPLGHWLAGVPKNIPPERQKAAVAFLKWFQTKDAQVAYAEAGSPPVRIDVLESALADDPKFRWMRPLADGLKLARQPFFFREAAQVLAVLELRLNQTMPGELTPDKAADTMAAEIADIMTKAGYTAPRLSK